MSIVIGVMIFGFLCTIIPFILVSIKEKSYLNILFPSLLFSVPINYILEPGYLYLTGELSGSVYAYCYIYLCEAATSICFAWAYLKTSSTKQLKLPYNTPNLNSSFWAYLFLIVGFLLYLPVLIEFRDYIFTPRRIYELTRTGYGIYFFASTFFCNVALVLALFSKRLNFIQKTLFCTIIFVLAYLHGSKGQILVGFVVILLYNVYIREYLINIKKFIVIALLSFSFGCLLFYLTLSRESNNFLLSVIGYSDYNRNAIMIIDNEKQLSYGKIAIEKALLSRVPRALYPEKPIIFGAFRLADKYYPASMDLNQGVPAFGIGEQYADFGDFSIIYLCVWAIFNGLISKIFVNRLKKYYTPGDFIIVLSLAGINAFPLGTVYLLFEHVLLGIALNWLLMSRKGPYLKIYKMNLIVFYSLSIQVINATFLG